MTIILTTSEFCRLKNPHVFVWSMEKKTMVNGYIHIDMFDT